MILNWETLKTDNPIAVQVIEKITGFTYESAYGVLMKDGKSIKFDDLERFFDDWGWRINIISGDYPSWGVAIVDRNNDLVYSELNSDELNSRNHAKSKAAGVGVTLLNQLLKETFQVDGSELIVEPKDLLPGAEQKPLGTLVPSDFTLDAQGLIANHNIALYKVNNDYVVLKNALGKLPFPGLILSFDACEAN